MAFLRICFWFLIVCGVIYAGQLALAALLMAITSPPVCHIAFSGLSPAPVCTRFGWSFDLQYAYSLPGAIFTYPLEIAPSAANPIVLLNPLFLTVMLVHICAWIYGFQLIATHLRNR